MKIKNNKPSSEFEHEDKCPSCGSPCNIHTDLDDNDECNDCRNQIDILEIGQIIPKEDTKISKEEPINCPKCRTSNFKNCHSVHCPMRKKEPKQTVQEYEQQGLEKYPHELESKQEALEEAAIKWVFEINGDKWSNNDNTAGDNYGSFITGAKWQQKQDENLYTEEDLREAFRQGEQNISYSETYGLDSNLTEQKWFERFKKK